MKNLNIISADIGAGSGRVILTNFDGNVIKSKEIYRFANNSIYLRDTLYWDFLNILFELKNGFRKAVEETGSEIISIGVDTWGADFGLLDSYGNLISNPVSYRDKRTEGIEKYIYKIISRDELNRLNSSLTYNYCTLFQLFYVFKFQNEIAKLAACYLPMPNLINYFLTGEKVVDQSIISGSQFFDVKSRKYRTDILRVLNINENILPVIDNAGEVIGNISNEFQESTNLPASVKVALVCSHDSPSAVIGIPLNLASGDCCYINSGTWSVVGLESEEPILTDNAADYNFTNWRTFRNNNMFVKIFNGFYFIQECKKIWDNEDGQVKSYKDFYSNIKLSSKGKALVNLDSSYLHTGRKSMPDTVADYFKKTSQNFNHSRIDIIISLLQSMVLEYGLIIGELEKLSGRNFKKIYMFGGGSLNKVFCQWIADCLGKDIHTGCSESTINGNIIVQLFALGEIDSIKQGREIIRKSNDEIIYYPDSLAKIDWCSLKEKYMKLKDKI